MMRNQGQSKRHARLRRGFTLLETLLAISITAMVGAGIATMMTVLGSDASMQYDLRSVLVRSSAAQSRLSAYIAPARCLLVAEKGSLVLWFDDARDSNTIHASELRWITHDPDTRSVNVEFVSFPISWSQSACALADTEYGPSANWLAVRDEFDARGLLVNAPLIDDVETVDFKPDDTPPVDAHVVETELAMVTSANPIQITLSESIRMHHPPTQ